MGTDSAFCNYIRNGTAEKIVAGQAGKQPPYLPNTYLLLPRKVSMGKVAQDFACLVNVTQATKGTSHLVVLSSTQLKNALIF